MADPKLTAADLANWREIARRRAEAREARLVEFGTFLEAMLSEVLDDLDLSGIDDLHAAYDALREAQSDGPAVRLLGREQAAEWRARFESLLGDAQTLKMFNRAWDALTDEERAQLREEREEWLGSHSSASDVRRSGNDDWDAAFDAAREDVRRAGAAEMSEDELIAAAEAAKREYRRQRLYAAYAEAAQDPDFQQPTVQVQGRITNEPGFLDLVDVIGRGGTADWQEIYARAKASASLRAEIRDALRLVDPELGSARELWSRLLDQMEGDG